ncbi:hypothetical protein D3875_00815 [Deinococcus cavernae]|uniref:Uncharacterized protein n=1 Tax=Deinococcus cavernae TaxID=2320857 RepID=A0A418VHI7_9DEIO|nr:hypothetical protein [Deinococcus cavernae]RJF75623.1 hypothetical protein D3875_00815 [Deinococcus cavernae]
MQFSLSQPHAVGHDATTQAFELFDHADHTVALKAEELLPDFRFLDPGATAQNVVFVQFTAQILEYLVQHGVIQAVGDVRLRDLSEVGQEFLFDLWAGRKGSPHALEPPGQELRLLV